MKGGPMAAVRARGSKPKKRAKKLDAKEAIDQLEETISSAVAEGLSDDEQRRKAKEHLAKIVDLVTPFQGLTEVIADAAGSALADLLVEATWRAARRRSAATA
jgi:hypothetical protein